MSYRNSTIWELEPHTEAKHQVLRKYLNAWLPIMSSWNARIVYIDGFAGPGIYDKGEDGSPVIAIKAALEHIQPIHSKLVFYFIEYDQERFKILKNLLKDYDLPSNFKMEIINNKFDEHLTEVLDTVDSQFSRSAPTFAFIDPFGYSHTPFSIVKRLASNLKCEMLITFMYEEINRFWDVASEKERLDRLFGCVRPSLEDKSPEERRTIIHDLYLNQLRKNANFKFVRSFEMVNKGNRTDYFLIFGTNHQLGLVKMKESMWRVDPSGAFEFSDATSDPNQLALFAIKPDYASLSHSLTTNFADSDPVDIKEIEHFTIEQTPFLATHIKKNVLVPLEKEGHIQIVSSPRKRRNSYPPGTVIKFLPRP